MDADEGFAVLQAGVRCRSGGTHRAARALGGSVLQLGCRWVVLQMGCRWCRAAGKIQGRARSIFRYPNPCCRKKRVLYATPSGFRDPREGPWRSVFLAAGACRQCNAVFPELFPELRPVHKMSGFFK